MGRERRYRDRSESPCSRNSKSSRKPKKSKKAKKYSHRNRSSSSSRSPSSDDTRRHHSRRSSRNRKSSSESNSRSATASASSAGTQVPATATKNIDLTDTKVLRTLESIEEDSFAAAPFKSSRENEKRSATDKVIIDLNAETVIAPKPPVIKTQHIEDDVIFHPNFIGDPDLKAEKWVRKLFNYRQKYAKEL